MTPRPSAILTYHSLDDSGSVISTPPDTFRRQMEFLIRSSIPVVPLEDIQHRQSSVAITFDDAYGNFLDRTVPILESLRLPATVFVVSGYCGGRNNWPGQPSGGPDLPLMAWQDLKSLPSSISVGAHTVTHPRLAALNDAECERELYECQNDIERHLQKPVRCLAYPYGSRSARVMESAKRRFDIAVSASMRFLSPQSCSMDLPRIDAFYLRGRFSIEHLFQPLGALYLRFRASIRNARCPDLA